MFQKSPPSPTKPAVSTALPTAAAIPPPTLLFPKKEVEMVQAYKEMPTVPQVIPAVPLIHLKPKQPSDANGIKPRKPCNCTKSQCLKL